MLQAILADFMEQGRLAPHVRRMRIEYARRRQAVLAALARHCPEITPMAGPGGLHLTLLLPPASDEAAILRRARARGLSASPLGLYYVGAPRLKGLVIGFANTPVPIAADAVRRLGRGRGRITGPCCRARHDKANRRRPPGFPSG